MKGKFLPLISTAITLALSSTVAVAQSTKFPNRDFDNSEATTETADKNESIVAAADEKLSPDAMEILCKRFPLNSRCEGANAETTSPEETDTEVSPSEDSTSPENSIETEPGTTPEVEAAPEAEDAPTQITPLPGTTPEVEAAPEAEDSPTNITPVPGNGVI